MSSYQLEVAVKGAGTALQDMRNIGFGISSIMLLSTRYLATEIQVEKAETAIANAEIQRTNELMKLNFELEREALTSANVQTLTERQKALVNELSSAQAGGTASSYQYQAASALLMKTNTDLSNSQLTLQKEQIQLSTTNNQLQINQNNLDMQAKVLNLDLQRQKDMADVLNLSWIQLIGSGAQVVVQIVAMTLAYRAAQAAQLASWESLVLDTDTRMASIAILSAQAGTMPGLTAATLTQASAQEVAAITMSAWDIASVAFAAAGIAALAVLGYYMATSIHPSSETPSGNDRGRAPGWGGGRGQYGGIVTSPTMMLVGEAGPERIIPQTAGGGGGGATVNVNIGGAIIGGSSMELSEQIGEIVNRHFDRYIRSQQP